MDDLRAQGHLRVPVIMSGDRTVYAGNLDEVADFLGIGRTGHRMLPAAQLVEKYGAILAAVQDYLRAFPAQHIDMKVPRREARDMRQLGYHVFAIAEDLMQVKDGDDYRQGNWPVPDSIRTFDEIVAYGDGIRQRLADWFAKQPESVWSQTRTTSYGAYPMHFYLERATWHSAQHSRQIVEMLKFAGVDATNALSAQFFAGLPIPKNIWE
jgi:hypothetical protein